jgi:hypothetical protein
MAIWFWFQAPKLYDYHLNMKEHNPLMFKIIGYNEKYLKDRALWIRRFRIYVVVMTGLMFSILMSILF